ncbi:hypothetical protein EG328_008791 [Venturia inaequalis]|nr:hypothetical protein EG328_008791 [Venturia inaequalis]
MLDLRSRAFVQGLEQRVLIDFSGLDEHLRHRPGRATPHVQKFQYDSATQGIIMGTQTHGDSKPVHSLISILPSEDSSKGRLKYSRHNLRPIMAFHCDISSVTLTSQRTLITTTRGSYSLPEMHITTLLPPHSADRTQPLDGFPSVRLKPKEATTIWCSSSFPTSPDLTPETVALGTNLGILLLDNRRSNWKSRETYKCNSDVLALSWLSPTLVTGGLRTGGVVIYDIRARGGIQRFSHPSPVINMNPINDGQRILIGGMANEMCLYDLRMLKEETKTIRVGEGHWTLDDEDGWGGGTTGGDLSWRKPFKKKVKSAIPAVRFKYNNTVYPLGMDVSQELGLVAAGEEDGNIGIWSLNNGERVRTLCTDRVDGRTGRAVEPRDFVKCLRFVEEEGVAPRLMASAGSKIIEWAW